MSGDYCQPFEEKSEQQIKLVCLLVQFINEGETKKKLHTTAEIGKQSASGNARHNISAVDRLPRVE